MIKKNFEESTEVMKPADKITAVTVDINGQKYQRITAQPRWRWSVDLKPVFKTDSCPVDHLLFVISGKMGVKMDDGQELSFEAGDLASIPPGHDGWGVDDEPTVWL